MDLEKKISIVTGASSGIGTAFSRKLIEKGATVYGLARRIQKLEKVREQLGERFIPVQMDITEPLKPESWVQEAFKGEHLPHVLINNAGMAHFGNVEDVTVEQWHTMMNTNVNGVFYLTRLIVPLMKKNPDHSHIINIASVAGLLGNPQISGYNATKFAVRGFSEALFKELRYDNIKVSTMFPGSIATDFFENADAGNTHPNMMHPSDVADTLIHLLETPDNLLINEVTLRPLNPKKPE